MPQLVIGLLICVALAIAVLALVAVPARRQGRDLLTERGERVVVKVRTGAESAVAKTGEVVSNVTPDRKTKAS